MSTISLALSISFDLNTGSLPPKLPLTAGFQLAISWIVLKINLATSFLTTVFGLRIPAPTPIVAGSTDGACCKSGLKIGKSPKDCPPIFVATTSVWFIVPAGYKFLAWILACACESASTKTSSRFPSGSTIVKRYLLAIIYSPLD